MKHSRLFSPVSHDQQFFYSSEVTKLAIPELGFSRNTEFGISWGFLGLNKKELKFSGSIKKKSQRIWFHSQEVSYNFAGFPGMQLFLSRGSMGEIPNLENQGDFLKKYLSTHLFSGIAQFTDNKPISDELLQSWITLFYIFFPVFKPKRYDVMSYMYPDQGAIAAMTTNVKCIVTWL